MAKNECGKTRGVNQPYEVWIAPEWEWRILKKYQSPEREAANPYARWLTAVKSPFTGDTYDMGDTYVSEITNNATQAVIVDLESWRDYSKG